MIDAGVGTSDSGQFIYQEMPYMETASLGRIGGFPGFENLGKVLSRISGKKVRKKDISGWSDSYDLVLEYEDPLEGLFQRENLLGFINQRVSTLERVGEEEGISFSYESKEWLIEFFNKRLIKNKPFIFLLENGNLRAVWKTEAGQQIGLQFLPDGNI